jgi:release factor glutamine methyltransferase
MGVSVKEALQRAAERIAHVCERPRFEAEVLLSYHMGVSRLFVMAHPEAEVHDTEAFERLVDRRAAHEPVEYITGKASFYDIELGVEPGVLIPRPETELLVDEAARIIRAEGYKRIVEVGVGSGAISIVLARLFENLHITASDISKKALEIARRNAKAYGVDARMTFVHTDLIEGIDVRDTLVVSNPPYIAEDAPLNRNVKSYEPHEALFGGKKGDEVLKRLIDACVKNDAAYLVCETGYDQRAALRSYIEKYEHYDVTFYNDLAGLQRGMIMARKGRK